MNKKILQYSAGLFPGYFSKKVKNPIFIIGAGRSGTTLLKNLLAQADKICSYPGEANKLWHPELYPWVESEYRDSVPPHWHDAEAFTNRSLELRDEGHDKTIQSTFGAFQYLRRKKNFLNKSAMLTNMIPYVDGLFPTAKYIHIYRNPKAVIRSATKKTLKKMKAYPSFYKKQDMLYNYEDLLEIIANNLVTQLAALDKNIKNKTFREAENYFKLSYEDFCKKPEEIFQQILNFLNLPITAIDTVDFDIISSKNYKYKNMEERHLRTIENLVASSDFLSKSQYQ